MDDELNKLLNKATLCARQTIKSFEASDDVTECIKQAIKVAKYADRLERKVKGSFYSSEFRFLGKPIASEFLQDDLLIKKLQDFEACNTHIEELVLEHKHQSKSDSKTYIPTSNNIDINSSSPPTKDPNPPNKVQHHPPPCKSITHHLLPPYTFKIPS